jgi:dihydroorotase
LTRAPAKLFHLPVGNLQPGSEADVVIFDPNEEWVVDPSRFHSKSQNTPFAGWTVTGKVKLTMVGGRIVYDAR